MIINICWTKQGICHTSLLSATLICTPFIGDMVIPHPVFNGTCTKIEVIIFYYFKLCKFVTSVSVDLTNEIFFISSIRAILISIKANRIPIQLRGPVPNGRKHI